MGGGEGRRGEDEGETAAILSFEFPTKVAIAIPPYARTTLCGGLDWFSKVQCCYWPSTCNAAWTSTNKVVVTEIVYASHISCPFGETILLTFLSEPLTTSYTMDSDDDAPPMLVDASGEVDGAETEELRPTRVPITIITGKTKRSETVFFDAKHWTVLYA